MELTFTADSGGVGGWSRTTFSRTKPCSVVSVGGIATSPSASMSARRVSAMLVDGEVNEFPICSLEEAERGMSS